jgi:flagellar motor switch protein FliM
MDKTLSQQEVDALLQAVRGGGVEEVGEEAVVQPASEVRVAAYDFRKPRLVSSDHLHGLQVIHEAFSRGLTSSVFTSLKTQMDVKPVAIDSIVYSEFIMSLMNPTFVSMVSMAPLPGEIVVEMNLGIVLTLTDILLGGTGLGVPDARELTAMERSLAGSFMDYLLAELSAAWSGIVDLRMVSRAVECNPELVRIVSPETPVFSVTFDARVNETTGTINICYPYEVVQPLLPRIAARVSGRKEKSTRSDRERSDIIKAVSGVPLELRVEIGMGTLSANQLGSLKPGDVVCLDRQIDELADVHIGNRACFKGSLCASRSRAAVRIVKRISEKNQDGPADRHEAKPK